jgi:hypothetical protein
MHFVSQKALSIAHPTSTNKPRANLTPHTVSQEEILMGKNYPILPMKSEQELKKAAAIKRMSTTVKIRAHKGNTITFVLPSESDLLRQMHEASRIYAINLNMDKDFPWHCTCEGYKYHRDDNPEFRCKHIKSVALFLNRLALKTEMEIDPK